MASKRIKDWATSITSFRSGDVIAVDGPSGTAKMSKDSLLQETAQNALAGNVAPAFDPTRTSENPYKAGESVAYNGKTYTFKVDHYGAWSVTDVYTPFDLSCLFGSRKNIVDAVVDEAFDITREKIFSSYDDENNSATNLSNAPFIINKDLSGFVISSFEIKFYTTGTFSVGICKKVPKNGDDFNSSDIENICVITIGSTGYKVIELPKPIVIPNNYRLCISSTTDTAKFVYGIYGEEIGFLYVNHSTDKYVSGSTHLGINIIGYKYFSIKNNLEFLTETVAGENKVFIDGYSVDNVTEGTYGNSPYVLVQEFADTAYLEAIQINVRGAGRVSVGTVKKTDVVVGNSYDRTKFIVKEVFSTTTTGVQEFRFSSKIKINAGELVFVGIPGDTLTFYYGSVGKDKGFIHPSGGVYVQSASSVNVIVSVFQPAILDSVYKGKKISILGDSISTFAGYITEGNATYYPSGSVQSVTDTWWKKLIDALGLVLDVNNSWSGSRVTTTSGETSAGCGDRAEALGTSPDVIIVWMGINDFNAEVALGTYDGKSAVPATTTTFREAYAIMLNKILTKYQSAEVWVCTLPQCERNGSSGFPEINGNGVPLADFNEAILELANAFGVKVLDHNKCGLTYQNMPTFNTDQLHPNKYGHSLLANNDIREMDNFVRTRYPIE